MPLTPDHASWDDYDSRLNELFPALAPGDGVPEPEVSEAERRLGLRLPRVLRELYLRAGRRDDINRPFNRLVAPGALSVHGGVLAYYEENQGVVVWGVRLEDAVQDDPPVVVSANESEASWEPDHEHLSGFLTTMLYWQAVNGGLPYVGVAAIDETEISAVRSYWPHVDLMGVFWEHMLVFHRLGQVVCVTGRAPELQLHAGGRTRDDFLAIQERLGLYWDYSTLEGEGRGLR
jgi:hypothetical protein